MHLVSYPHVGVLGGATIHTDGRRMGPEEVLDYASEVMSFLGLVSKPLTWHHGVNGLWSNGTSIAPSLCVAGYIATVVVSGGVIVRS